MKVFMLGWEFPPLVSGGLGVACYGLAKALNGMGVDVMFVLPKPLAKGAASMSVSRAVREKLPLPARFIGTGPESRHELREVQSASAQEVQAAVEKAAHQAEAQDASERETPSAQPAVSREFVEEVHQVETAVESVEPVRLQRVTFVPVNVFLEPYMTPGQYERMVVEELVREQPAVRWEKRFERHGGRWVERALPGEPVQPPQQRHSGSKAAAPARRYLDNPSSDQAEQPVIGPEHSAYSGDLFAETERYARLALSIAKGEDFDVVHAHDWMTFEAAMAVAAATGKPLIVQIHSTEIDRAGANANSRILEVEREGMMAADRVIAVSYRTRTQLIERYGIDPRKIFVVYNAAEEINGDSKSGAAAGNTGNGKKRRQRNVLFLGRLVAQKGPEYFLQAAKKVLTVEPDVRFVVAGKGEMLDALQEMAEDLGIERRVVFAGFLKKAELAKTFKAADVYVMPSVSEPFGIAPLEALSHDVPVIISKQSGVAEVLQHVLKVDFWDTEELANKILAVLRHPSLAQTLREEGHEEVRQFSWDDSAGRIMELYEQVAPGSRLGRRIREQKVKAEQE